MTKVIFILHRRDDIDRETFLREWSGDQHISIAKKIPGLRKVVQNHPVPDPSQDAPACDGIAELWFDNSDTMQHAFESPEWTAAIEDGKRYADFAVSHSLIVKEVPLW